MLFLLSCQYNYAQLFFLDFRIKLRRVTTASYLPEFKIGSQQNVNERDGAEVAGEALEMLELRRGNFACS